MSVKQDYVKKSQITEAVSTLYGKNADIVGCVFNGVRRRHSRYGYGYGYGYGKYGYGSSKYGYGKSGYTPSGNDADTDEK